MKDTEEWVEELKNMLKAWHVQYVDLEITEKKLSEEDLEEEVESWKNRYNVIAAKIKKLKPKSLKVPFKKIMKDWKVKKKSREKFFYLFLRSLKRKDLAQHIARNDLMGDFNLEKALEDKDDRQTKVLRNIIESAMEAEKNDNEWENYQQDLYSSIRKERDGNLKAIREAIKKNPGDDESKEILKLELEKADLESLIIEVEKSANKKALIELLEELETINLELKVKNLKRETESLGRKIKEKEQKIKDNKREIEEKEQEIELDPGNQKLRVELKKLKDEKEQLETEGKKIIGKNEQLKIEKEKTENYISTREKDHELGRSREVETQALMGIIYDTAILGAGASAAYFIANNTLDLKKTVLIGQKQPWAGQRGGDGQINHPHTMIDPENYGEIDEDEGLAKRKEFSKRIAKVINKIPNHCDARITKVIKEKSNGKNIYWKIETNKGTYFARKVHSALGAGEHISRGNAGVDMDTYKRSIEKVSDKNIDFTIGITGGSAAIDVVTDVLRKYNKAKVCWAPGSSGAAFLQGTDNDVSAIPYFEALKEARIRADIKAMRKEKHLKWVKDTGKGEKEEKKANDELEKAEASKEKIEKEIKKLEPSIIKSKKEVSNWDKLSKRVTVYPGRGGIKENKNFGKNDYSKEFLLRTSEGDIEVDKAVYAVGQDNVALSELFVDNTGGGGSSSLEVTPVLDVNQHFNISGVPNLANLRDKLPEKDDFGKFDSKKMENPEKLKSFTLPLNPGEDPPESVDLLEDPKLNSLILKKVSSKLGVGLDAQSSDGSLKFVGAQGFRELEAQRSKLSSDLGEKFKKKYVFGSEEDKKQYNDLIRGIVGGKDVSLKLNSFLQGKGHTQSTFYQDFKPLFDTCEALKSMDSVTDTLTENVLSHAQLTSARERIVAEANSMPGLLTPDGLSFITANQTAIAVHIATYYPNIDPPLANYVTAQIIVSRCGKNGPIPQRRKEQGEEEPEHDLKRMLAFQQCWVERLKYFNEQSA